MPTIQEAHFWYPEDDPVHGFDHILRVYHLAERLALAEGADMEIVCAAALLHDANRGEPVSSEKEPSQTGGTEHWLQHQNDSAELAHQVLKAEGWSEERIAAVLHCIRSHRFRNDSELPQTLEAQVLFDADKLDAMGAVGVARTIAYAARAGQPVYVEPSHRFQQTGFKEPGEPHSAYHEYLFKLVRLKDRLYTASARSLAEERHRWMVEFFERLTEEVEGER